MNKREARKIAVATAAQLLQTGVDSGGEFWAHLPEKDEAKITKEFLLIVDALDNQAARLKSVSEN